MNNNSKLNKTSKATSMAELLASYKSPFVTFTKGQLVKGKITKLTSSEILIDVSAKTEAVVLEKDKKILRNLLATLKVGDEVTVSVLNPESDLGHPVVSLRRFIDSIAWEKLAEIQKNKETIEVLVDEITRGGFLVTAEQGLSGFLPNSHISFLQNPQDILGKKIKVFVLELNKPLHKIIFSQKPMIDIKDFEAFIKEFKIGQKISATVANITPFGVFVNLPKNKDNKTVDGLIHISEISWNKVEDITKTAIPGEKIEAIVIGFDKEAKRIDLSIKRITQDPLEETINKYTIDQKVKGIVIKILSIGALLKLEEGIEGFIRKEKIPPTVNYKEGDEIQATVSQIDKEKHRLILIPILKEKPIGYR